MHSPGSAPFICEHCQTPFTVRPSLIARGCGHFCCIACRRAFRLATTDKRFWAKVDKNGPVPDHRPELGPCWTWVAFRIRFGYGYVTYHGHPRLAHRIAWTLTFGDIPEGLFVLHACDTPACVNPSHLFLGTNMDNQCDMIRKGRDRKNQGDSHRWSKLRAAFIPAIRERHALGETVNTLALDYNVVPQTIWDVLNGRTWKSVA